MKLCWRNSLKNGNAKVFEGLNSQLVDGFERNTKLDGLIDK